MDIPAADQNQPLYNAGLRVFFYLLLLMQYLFAMAGYGYWLV
jgi:hypothetical protein